MGVVDSGNVIVVKEILKHPRVDVNRPEGCRNPLLQACFKGDTQMVKVLLSAPKINVNFCGAGNYSALYFAACNGSTEIVKLLM